MTGQSNELAKFLDHKMIKQASKPASSKALPESDDQLDSLLDQLALVEATANSRKHH
ncbi:hypothetical protein [Agrobacterium rosae]|uniref:hypothetical protein n=1 Tax=Agrobacterium rosae TaxID=1972867 RepID=UPI003BA276EF